MIESMSPYFSLFTLTWWKYFLVWIMVFQALVQPECCAVPTEWPGYYTKPWYMLTECPGCCAKPWYMLTEFPGMLYMLTEWPGCCVSVMVSLPFGLTWWCGLSFACGAVGSLWHRYRGRSVAVAFTAPNGLTDTGALGLLYSRQNLLESRVL